MSQVVVKQEKKLPEEVPKALQEALEPVHIESYEIRRVGLDPLLIVNGKVVGGWLDL
ncbi:MAG: hypothetical protein QW318_06720 [Candidatus Caldarchaeum sp.]